MVLNQLRSGEWLEDPGFGVYVHIPFCRHRCHYCDFNTYEGLEDLHSSYVDALVASIGRARSVERVVTSIFFGGGTPTLLPPAELARIVTAVAQRFRVASDAEVTCEVNPETVDEASFESLLAAGFNRFSIGAQSLVSHVLTGLGRTHSGHCALSALAAARRAGASDVNLDLIYGSSLERPTDWMASLEGVLAAGPDHISAYALTVEEGTPLHTLVRSGRVADVDPDVQAERHEVATEVLGAAGFHRYEISNWARPGHPSRHNVLYWSGGEYAAFGAGAHGHLDGTRWWATRLPRDFIAQVGEGRDPVAGRETLAADERAGEALMLGLRLASGIELDAFTRRFGADALASRWPEVRRLASLGLVEITGARLALSDRGTQVANEVAAALL
jgi:putative oxygen-independent coproporphyrinogen III oxidase